MTMTLCSCHGLFNDEYSFTNCRYIINPENVNCQNLNGDISLHRVCRAGAKNTVLYLLSKALVPGSKLIGGRSISAG